jgi:hypothetical protein
MIDHRRQSAEAKIVAPVKLIFDSYKAGLIKNDSSKTPNTCRICSSILKHILFIQYALF